MHTENRGQLYMQSCRLCKLERHCGVARASPRKRARIRPGAQNHCYNCVRMVLTLSAIRLHLVGPAAAKMAVTPHSRSFVCRIGMRSSTRAIKPRPPGFRSQADAGKKRSRAGMMGARPSAIPQPHRQAGARLSHTTLIASSAHSLPFRQAAEALSLLGGPRAVQACQY